MRTLPLTVTVLLLAGCPSSECPAGSVPVGGRCIPSEDAFVPPGTDANLDAYSAMPFDAGRDASYDAGADATHDAARTITLDLRGWVTLRPGETVMLPGRLVGGGASVVASGTVAGVSASVSPVAADGSFTASFTAASTAPPGTRGAFQVEASGPGFVSTSASVSVVVRGPSGTVAGTEGPILEYPSVGLAQTVACLQRDGSVLAVAKTRTTPLEPDAEIFSGRIGRDAILRPATRVAWNAMDPRLVDTLITLTSVTCLPDGGALVGAAARLFVDGDAEDTATLVLTVLDASGSIRALYLQPIPTLSWDCAVPPVVVGDSVYTSCRAVVRRLRLADLMADPSFGTDGLVSLAPNGWPAGVDSNGGFLIAGTNGETTRLTRDGRPDSTFAMAGRTAALPLGGMDSFEWAFALPATQPVGTLLLSQTRYVRPDGRLETRIARYLASGSFDPRFGVGGIVTLATLLSDGVALSDGSLVTRSFDTAAILRISPDGTVTMPYPLTIEGGGFVHHAGDPILFDEARGELLRVGLDVTGSQIRVRPDWL